MKRLFYPAIMVAILAVVSSGCGNSRSDAAKPTSVDSTAGMPANNGDSREEPGSLLEPTGLSSEAQVSSVTGTPDDAETIRLKSIQVPPPSFSPVSCVSKGAIALILSSSVAEAKIMYTLDGSVPVPGKSTVYSGPIDVASSSLVKALAFVPNGNTSKSVSSEYTIGELCAAPGGTGDGSRSRPLGSLKKAMDAARSSGIGVVKLSAGKFPGSVTVQSSLIISGGWNSGFSKKSPDRTVIIGESMGGTSKKNPGYALKVTGSGDMKFERLDLRGGESEYSTGLFVSGTVTPSFSACVFSGGDGSYAYGALVSGGANPLFTSCSFSGGTAPTASGLSIDSARATVHASILFAGLGNVTGSGATVTDGKIVAVNTVFTGNQANSCYGVALYNSRDSRFDACTFFGGSGRDANAIFVSVGNPVIVSSIIASAGTYTSYGIYDNYGESSPQLIQNCVFSGCETGLYFDADGKTAFTELSGDGIFGTASKKSLSKPRAESSFKVDLALGPVPGCKTPATAPESVTKGGIPASGSSFDAAGNSRSSPWSIGAYEIDR